jgi:heme/copper-type cytochrome/quinol oxidase subunit 4
LVEVNLVLSQFLALFLSILMTLIPSALVTRLDVSSRYALIFDVI